MNLIDAEKLREHIGIDRNSDCKKCQHYDDCRDREDPFFALEDICEFIDEQPIVDARPVVHAKWVRKEQKFDISGVCNCSGFYPTCTIAHG